MLAMMQPHIVGSTVSSHAHTTSHTQIFPLTSSSSHHGPGMCTPDVQKHLPVLLCVP